MSEQMTYPIGVPGQPWGQPEREAWRMRQTVKRSYVTDVLDAVHAMGVHLHAVEYGVLSYREGRYPLMALQSAAWQDERPTVLITGGVHGYETSGVHGALRVAQTLSQQPDHRVNWIIAPCVSPWGYETINRWNPHAVDPNRSFRKDSPAQEAALLMAFVDTLEKPVLMHIDLHETTDTDESEFRPAKAARDGKPTEPGSIPDGFYTVGHSDRPMPDFQRAVIDAVAQVTHIAPPDAHGQLIGVPMADRGVIYYDAGPLGLCMGLGNAQYTTTTEVYPDSPLTSPENCIQAQAAAVMGGLDYVLRAVS